MSSKRVLVVNIQSLLIGGTETLLKDDGNFSVVSSNSRDLATLVDEIERFVPDVIIMDKDTYFVQPEHLFVALCGIRNIRLIVLNNQTTVVNIFEKHEKIIAQPSQLVDVIGLRPSLADMK